MAWSVYVLVSASGGATYVGVTTDVQRRLSQHNGELPGGARSTRRDRPWTIGVVHDGFDDRAEAQRVEASLKRRRGSERLQPPGS